MNLGNSIIRGILHLSSNSPKIVAKCFGKLKPLTIDATDTTITGNVDINGATKLHGSFIGTNAMYGTSEPGDVIQNPKEGQIYFKIIT